MALPTSDNTVNVTRLGSILSTLWAKIKTALSGKQDKLTSQTAYSAKGTATKVPQITTNSLGQVTGITEVTISGVTPASHASTATTYGIGTTSTYGHVKLATGDMNGATNTDGVAVSKNHTHSQYAPKASPALTGTPTAPTAADGTNTTQIATTAFVQSAVAQGLSVSDAMVYKGTITLGASSPGGLTVAADKGHTYKVIANGTTTSGYVDGVKVEAGDMVICNTDSTAAATSSNYSTIAAKWDFVQGNTDGVVVGPASATSGNVVLFDGATGKLIKDGGKLGTSAFKDVASSGNASTTQVVMGNDSRLTDSRTPTSHSHGNITNGGALQTSDVAIASGDKLVITDHSDSDKVARASISFDGSTTTKALTQKGTFESFAKSSDITTAINTLDDSVVHINGNETIHDNKYFDGSLNMTLGNNSSTGVFMLGAVEPQPIYSEWTEAQKDGHHHREWTLAFPSNTPITAASTIRLTLYGGYYLREVMNPLSKTINSYLSLGANPVNFGRNLGYYNQLGGTIEDEFRISDIIWDSANSRPVIKIRDVMPEKNNYVLFVIVEYIAMNYQTRDWLRQLSWVSTSPTIVEDGQYFTRRSGQVTTEETTSNGRFFNWADKPVLQGPYGDEIQYNWVGTSSTGASDATKTVTIPGFQAVAGSKAVVFFSYDNTANNPKLNISSTGAKDIFFNGTKITTSLSKSILKGAILFIYDGTQYHIIGGSSPGINTGIQLTSSDNLNDIQASQLGEVSTYYWLYTQCPTNAPFNDKSCVMVLYGTSANTDKYRVQVAYYGDGGIYQRTQDNNVWSDWSKILTASDITASTNNGKIKVTGTDVTVYTHPAGSAASKTGVPTANATPAFGGTFKVNQITTDATSHVSAVTERTITIPNTTGNASTAGLTKLYTATGTNTDGTMTQNAIKSALDTKMSSTVSEDASNELQVVGVQSSATSTLKRDSGVTVQGGAVKATTFKLGTNATITYNSTTEAIDFTFL